MPASGSKTLTVGSVRASPVSHVEAPEESHTEWLTPCVEDSPQHEDAGAKLKDLSDAIHDLPITGDPKPLEARMTDLVKSRCFEVGAFEGHIGPFESALSLKTFWEAGGREWMSAPLA